MRPTLLRSQLKHRTSPLTSAPLMDRLAQSRAQDADEPLCPPLTSMLTWSGLLGIREAAARIAEAISSRQRIAIVGDYDADGATATGVLMRGLRAFGADCYSVVPSRFSEGYGLSPPVVAHVAKLQAKLIVTVDNGISAFSGIAAAKSAGIDVVVTDHHLPGASAPECCAIVNPNQLGCGFSSKNLAGCGVAFYVLGAIRSLLASVNVEKAVAFDLRALLPLVAIGTVADMVRLDANNRALVNAGLKRIRAGQISPGIDALIQVAGVNREVLTASDIGFKIGPRINAAGRMADMSVGIDCLTTDDAISGQYLALQLDETNLLRRTTQGVDLDEALRDCDDAAHQSSICVLSKSFHEGVIGVVAGRLREKFGKPTVVFKELENGNIKGSGRSVPGFHLRDALERISTIRPDMFIAFGGHAAAAGMTLSPGSFHDFRTMFESDVLAAVDRDPELLTESITHDGSLPLADATLISADAIALMPWGQGYAEPIFLDTFTVVSSRVLKVVHLGLNLTRGDQPFRAIWFNADMAEAYETGDTIELLYRLTKNSWNGVDSLQLMVVARVRSDSGA